MMFANLLNRIRNDISRAKRKVFAKRAKQLKTYDIYRTADMCPFLVFEKCLINEEYSALGEAPEDVLQAAWLSIYFEYLQLMDAGATNDRIRHLGQIHVLTHKINTSKIICESILETQLDLLVPVLHDLGYTFVKKIDDLARVVALIKRDEMDLKILVKNLPKDKGQKPSVETFNDIFFKLSEFLHTIVHKDKITVAEYCGLVNGYQKHIQSLNQKSSGK